MGYSSRDISTNCQTNSIVTRFNIDALDRERIANPVGRIWFSAPWIVPCPESNLALRRVREAILEMNRLTGIVRQTQIFE
jgi:hypothetical protein